MLHLYLRKILSLAFKYGFFALLYGVLFLKIPQEFGYEFLTPVAFVNFFTTFVLTIYLTLQVELKMFISASKFWIFYGLGIGGFFVSIFFGAWLAPFIYIALLWYFSIPCRGCIEFEKRFYDAI
jgi:hypothetical protein